MQYFGFDRPSFGIKTFGFGSSEFSPLDLFAGGKQGVWYDPSDKSTLFQDVAGTVPVTKDGDPVGLILDKSKGLELGEELAPKTKEDFIWLNGVPQDDITNKLPQSVESTGSQIAFNIRGFDPEKRYRIVLDIDTGTATRLYYRGTTPDVIYLPTGRSKRVIYTKPSDRGYLAYIFSTGANNITIHELSIKEIKGNHASQPLAASRPTYKAVSDKVWLYNDKVDDKLLVKLPAITATVVKATDEGVSINYPVNITAGDYAITSTSALGRDYSYLIINKELSVSEATQVTSYFNAKRGV